MANENDNDKTINQNSEIKKKLRTHKTLEKTIPANQVDLLFEGPSEEESASRKKIEELIDGYKKKFYVTAALCFLALFLSYVFQVQRKNVDFVFWSGEHYDKPVFLEKINSSRQELKTSNYIFGFARSYMRCYFINKDMDEKSVKSCLRFVYTHSDSEGEERNEVYLKDTKTYMSGLSENYVDFYPLTLMQYTINPSTVNANEFIFRIPGTFQLVTATGRRSYDAVLTLNIESFDPSPKRNKYGLENIYGLRVVKGFLEYQENVNIKEITNYNIFNGDQTRRKIEN